MIGKTIILDDSKPVEAMLEIQIEVEDFKKFLGRLSTLSFGNISSKGILQVKEVLPHFYKIPFCPLSEFLRREIIHYIALFMYVMATIGFMVIFYHLTKKMTEKKLQEELGLLYCTLSEEREKAQKISEDYNYLSEEFKNHQLSVTALKSLYTKIIGGQREGIIYYEKILREEGIENYISFSYPSYLYKVFSEERSLCLEQNASLFNAGKCNRQESNIKAVLESVQSLFADKIYRSNILIDINCSPSVCYIGDPLLLEIVLINIVGPTIFRAPKNGKIKVKIFGESEDLHIIIHDNGYSLASTAKRLIKKPSEFFMEEEDFGQLCLTHDIYIDRQAKKGTVARNCRFF